MMPKQRERCLRKISSEMLVEIPKSLLFWAKPTDLRCQWPIPMMDRFETLSPP
jgi:hypothetical protein